MLAKNKFILKIIGVMITCFSLTSCDFITDFINDIIFKDYIVKYKYSEVNINGDLISVSKGSVNQFTFNIEDRGIIFNKKNNGVIDNITFEADSSDAYIYFSDVPLGFDESYQLSSGNNVINPIGEWMYFVIQSETENLTLTDLNIEYNGTKNDINVNLPSINIKTKGGEFVTSSNNYVDCYVSTSGLGEEFNQLSGKIRIRGNSTAKRPKKPYRIKLDEKAPLFGYESAKNWALLADFMDASRIHNYAGLKFSKLAREDNEFSNTPLYVNLTLNGKYQGQYLFTEHIDETSTRLNIKKSKLWETDFNEIPLYLERDYSDVGDKTKFENVDYIYIYEDVYNIKYPEPSDFYEEKSDGTIDEHNDKFEQFVEDLKGYLKNIEDTFARYDSDRSVFDEIDELVDVNSLASYTLVDQFINEVSHDSRSMKLYRPSGQKLKFGPNWDYDSTVLNIRYVGYYVPNVYEREIIPSTFIGEHWGRILFDDRDNGYPLFKHYWNNVLEDNKIVEYYNDVYEQNKIIARNKLTETEKWIDKNYCITFDNTRYTFEYLESQINYLSYFYALV